MTHGVAIALDALVTGAASVVLAEEFADATAEAERIESRAAGATFPVAAIATLVTFNVADGVVVHQLSKILFPLPGGELLRADEAGISFFRGDGATNAEDFEGT